MKKITAFIMAMLMCVTVFATTASAAGTPTIKVSSETALRGEEVTVTVSIENNPGIAMLELPISYDSDRLEKVSYEVNNLPGGLVKDACVWVSSEESTFNGTILTLKFKVKEDAELGDANVSISVRSAGNLNEESVAFDVVNGKVTVTAPHVHEYEKVVTAPTCTAVGYTTYTCACGDSYKADEVAATGHTYGEPTFTWADDYSCKASYSCGTCGATVTVDATVTSKSTDASCTVAGTVTYTASVKVGEKTYTSEKVVTGVTKPHAYKAEFTWAEDHMSASLVLTCPDCDAAVQIPATDVLVTVETIEATTAAEGKVVYTASYTYEGVTYTAEYVEVLEKLPATDDSPKTGDAAPVVLMALAVLAAGAFVVLNKKRA